MAETMNLKERLQGPTPPFFKRVKKWAIGIVTGAGLVLSVSTPMGLVLAPVLVTILKGIVVAGIATGLTAQTTVDKK